MRSRVRKLAEAKYPTLVAFYKAAGISEATLRKWERRGLFKAQFGVLLRVADALDCEVTDLYE